MSKGKVKAKKKYLPVVLTNPGTKTRIVMRKNNPGKNQKKLSFMKYCPIQRKHLLFTETKRERHN